MKLSQISTIRMLNLIWICILLNSIPCFAKNEGVKKEFLISKKEDYQILFSKTGQTLSLKTSGEDAKEYHQISYKVIPISGTMQEYFGGNGFSEVRFKDSEGFVLATDLFERKDYHSELGYYGRIWVDSEKSQRLFSADLTALPSEDLELAQNERFRVYYEIRQFVDMDGRFLQEILPPYKFIPSSEERMNESPSSSEIADSKVVEKDKSAEIKATETAQEADENETLEHLSPFGKEPITNEMIAKTLEEFDKIPPTVVDSKQPTS